MIVGFSKNNKNWIAENTEMKRKQKKQRQRNKSKIGVGRKYAKAPSKKGRNKVMGKRHPMTNVILAGCHSLVTFDEHVKQSNEDHNDEKSDGKAEIREERSIRIIGDPLDAACLQYSGWNYDGTGRNATNPSRNLIRKRNKGKENGKSSKTTVSARMKMSSPVSLWQIKTLPFDPVRGFSSALVLVEYADGNMRLWMVMKGSPDAMNSFLHVGENDRNNDENNDGENILGDYDSTYNSSNSEFDQWYRDTAALLGMKGMRVIATGAKDVTDDLHLTEMLPGMTNMTTQQWVHAARASVRDQTYGDVFGRCLGQKNTKGGESKNDRRGGGLEFTGFACFDAPLRPGTHRVIRSIIESGIEVCMLTGDGVEAAVAVAKGAGILDHNVDGVDDNSGSIAVLDLYPSGTMTHREEDNTKKKVKNGNKLRWKIIARNRTSRGKQRLFQEVFIPFNIKSLKSLLVKGFCSGPNDMKVVRPTLVVTGRAIDSVISLVRDQQQQYDDKDEGNSDREYEEACMYFARNLSRVKVIARASPRTKRLVVGALKDFADRRVMMCGK